MFLKAGYSANIGGSDMFQGLTAGGGRLGAVDPATGIDPTIQSITQNAGYLTQWYRSLFPQQQQQTYVPVQTQSTTDWTMWIMLGGLGLVAFVLMKKK